MSSVGAAVSHSSSMSNVTKKSAATAVTVSGATRGSRSSFAKHATLPPITATVTSASLDPSKPAGEEGEGGGGNPFQMPPENELFTLREAQRAQAKAERAGQRKLKVHEKSTYVSRLNSKNASLRKKVMTPPESGIRGGKRKEGERGVSEDTDFVLSTTRDRRLEREDITGFVNRKREMFLVQYALGVKREEIRKLEDIARIEEQKLEAAEKYLQRSAEMFDEYVQENDRNASEAVRMSEAATKAKLEKMADIKKLLSQLVSIKNEISRNSETLTQLKQYQRFLHRLAPQEWKEQKEPKASKQEKEEEEEEEEKEEVEVEEEDKEGESGSKEKKDEERTPPPLYFTTPKQLVEIFSELEELNLSLIQNGQETEEALEDLCQTRKDTEKKLDAEIFNLKKQVTLLTTAITREETKGSSLEMNSKLLSFGEYKAEAQDQMIADLDKRVTEVYTKSIGPNEANLSSLQMLSAIEEYLGTLFETIESLPPDKVEAAEKVKEKERRMRARACKMEDQRHQQEARLRRMQERAQAGPQKLMGRKLVYRSEPPVMKRKQKDSKAQKEKEEEEMVYFFS